MYLSLSKALGKYGKFRVGAGIRITPKNFWYMLIVAMLYWIFQLMWYVMILEFWLIYKLFYYLLIWPFKKIFQLGKWGTKKGIGVIRKHATGQENLSSAELEIAKLQAQNCLRIIKDSDKIINSTKDPDVFFGRYTLVEEQMQQLFELQSKGVSLSGESLIEANQEINNKKQVAIKGFLDRFWCATLDNVAKVKTDAAKRRQYQTFYDTLEKYKDQMNEENIAFYTSKYQNYMYA